MKKFVAILLSVLMLFGCMSVIAFAADDEPETEYSVDVICSSAGDIDYDETISSADARYALRYAVELETDESLSAFGPDAVARGDIDGEEGVTAADARGILRLAVELDEQPGHNTKAETTDASWTVKGKTENVCAYCGKVIGDAEETPSKIDEMIDEANAWAEEKGVAGLIKGESEEDGAKLALVINVDAIWDGIELADGAFDGLLTKLGSYVNEKFADSVITLDGETVYNGKLLNTPVKKAIFSVFSGFFYKIATTQDGVYGVYALTVDGEDVELTVKMTGSDANVAKIQNFAQVIADHIWADTTGTDLVIGIEMPDALMNTVNAKGGLDKVNASTVGACLAALQAVELEDVIGSQVSAVNKLCKVVCGLDGFVNKVVGKVTAATVTVEGAEVDLLSGKAFAPASDDYEGLLDAVIDMISDQLKGVTMGSFAQKDGTYKVAVTVTVDVSNAGVMTNNLITETIYFVVNP